MALCPALFLSALYAIATESRSNTPRGARCRKSDSDACELIHRAGWSSHYSPRFGTSEWPLPRFGSVAELREFARVAEVLKKEPMAGDVYVAGHEGGACAQAGVVVQVLDRSRQPHVWLQRCEVVYGERGGDGGVVVQRGVRWFSSVRKDGFVRWVELDPVRTRLEPEEWARRR